MDNNERMRILKVSQAIEEYIEALKSIRRDLHQIPELAFEEFQTALYIENYLKRLNIPYEKGIVGTGIIGYIKGKEGKRTYCFRADMDALTVDEQTNVEYRSLHPGRMHACGHDGHMTILLGLGKYLVEHQDKLRDNIVLLFQPAEEGPGGALPIVEGGYLDRYNVDEIYGLHLFPGIDEGKIGLRPGAMMSQTGEFDIYIQGRSGHGAMPHTAIDSVVIGAEMILSIQSIVSRSVNPIQPAVITIGRLEGGERRNIIAKEVVLEGTIRTFSQEVYDGIKKRMVQIGEGLEKVHQCQVNIVFRDMYPPVINDVDLTKQVIESQEDGVVEMIDPIMLAEDFSYYQMKYPGVFFFLGSRNQEKQYIAPLHNSQFNFDEKILGYGVQTYVNILKHRGALGE